MAKLWQFQGHAERAFLGWRKLRILVLGCPWRDLKSSGDVEDIASHESARKDEYLTGIDSLRNEGIIRRGEGQDVKDEGSYAYPSGQSMQDPVLNPEPASGIFVLIPSGFDVPQCLLIL